MLIGRLVTALEGKGGYSRLVAGRALLNFFEDEENRPYLTDSAARAIATQVVEIAESVDGKSVYDYDIAKGPLPGAFVERICPRCVLWVDGKRHVLGEKLPKGWKARDGTVELDGRRLAGTSGFYESTLVYEPVNVRAHLTGKIGEHVLVSALTLVAPNGLSIKVRDQGRFRVVEWRLDKILKD